MSSSSRIRRLRAATLMRRMWAAANGAESKIDVEPSLKMQNAETHSDSLFLLDPWSTGRSIDPLTVLDPWAVHSPSVRDEVLDDSSTPYQKSTIWLDVLLPPAPVCESERTVTLMQQKLNSTEIELSSARTSIRDLQMKLQALSAPPRSCDDIEKVLTQLCSIIDVPLPVVKLASHLLPELPAILDQPVAKLLMLLQQLSVVAVEQAKSLASKLAVQNEELVVKCKQLSSTCKLQADSIPHLREQLLTDFNSKVKDAELKVSCAQQLVVTSHAQHVKELAALEAEKIDLSNEVEEMRRGLKEQSDFLDTYQCNMKKEISQLRAQLQVASQPVSPLADIGLERIPIVPADGFLEFWHDDDSVSMSPSIADGCPEKMNGAIVVLHNLRSMPVLNGLTATITGWNYKSGRYAVKCDGHKELAIKSSNLIARYELGPFGSHNQPIKRDEQDP